MASVASFTAAGAIWFTQQRLEERNLTVIESGEASLADGGFGGHAA